MFRTNYFFFNDGAAENSGGVDTTTVIDNEGGELNEQKSEPLVEQPIAEKIDLPLSKMKEFGFDSMEQMEAFFAKQKELNRPDEEKQKEVELENATFRAFAIKEGHLKEEDFNTHAAYVKAVDKELVFEKSFLPDFKEENPEIEDESDLIAAAKAEFDAEYKTASAKRIAKEAAEIRSEITSKYESAKTDYEYNKKWESGKDGWSKLVKETMEALLPGEDIVLFEGKDGENDIKVDVKLTTEEKAEIFKKVVTPKLYQKFLDGKSEEVVATIKERVMGAAIQKSTPAAIKRAIELGIEIGQAKNPAPGARNSFAMVDNKSNLSGIPDKTLDEQIRDSHNKAATRFH